MKCSESWLREWVNPKLTGEELASVLTMAGLEVEELIPVAQAFTGVVVGEILKVEKHPEADRLNVCKVDVARPEPLTIVCGAENVKAGMKVPVALIGAELPNKKNITHSSIRNVASEGMLCSAVELGLAEQSKGLLALPQEATVGLDLREYLQLDDYVIDISITPNRGDCLSMQGIAREVAALTQTPLTPIVVPTMEINNKDTIPVTVSLTSGCPRYVGRVIKNVKTDIATPSWLQERLRRGGVRSINPVVDVTNYVMLELGQPMHAFDLSTIEQGINVRVSRQGEKIALLDGSEKVLDAETMVIADHTQALAIAGVMGGLNSGVTSLTHDIFLESAYFSPAVIARQRQFYGLNSESAYRFERGVDPEIQGEALERATQLIIEIAGGEVGPVVEVATLEYLAKPQPILLTPEKIVKVLGISLSNQEVERIFKALNFTYQWEKNHWVVSAPSYRFDISHPEDLIEELARIYGYDKIPTHHPRISLQVNQMIDQQQGWYELRQAFSDQGYHEIISYSFIDKKLQALLDPEQTPIELLNPITSDMAVMRTNLWPGLVNTLLYNQNRQQQRARLFEIGACFIPDSKEIAQIVRLGGLMTGLAYAEQWGMPAREADFYDLKGSIENILKLFYPSQISQFKPDLHPALHPGQTAAIYCNNKKIGIMGALHPSVLQALDLTNKAYLFELDVNGLQKEGLERIRDISKFPEIRRDIAVIVKQAIPVKDIQDTIKRSAGDWLKDIFIFDVYQGKGITPGLKSVALALILQHPTRTLVDDEVAELLERVITTLKGQLGAELRS